MLSYALLRPWLFWTSTKTESKNWILSHFYFELDTTFTCYAEVKMSYRQERIELLVKILEENKLRFFSNILPHVAVAVVTS